MAAGAQETAAIHEEGDSDYYCEDREAGSWCGCGCFRLPWRRQNGGGEEAWLGRKLKKVKELSEVVAGPKWKNFVRKVGGYFNGNRNKRQRFQYDSHSYALNFDSGVADHGGEDDGLLLNYSSSRVSAPLSHH